VVTGGIVTARDSKWLLSWTVNRQPHFKQQPKDQIVVWVYALFVDTPGDYVKKPMQECTGEAKAEAAYQLLGIERGVPEVFGSTYDIRRLLEATVCLRDKEEVELHVPEIIRKRLIGKLTDNEIGELLVEYGLIKDQTRYGEAGALAIPSNSAAG